MYLNPLVVGVRQAPSWDCGETVEQTMVQLGMNTGNMVFTESLVKVLKDASWAPFNFQDKDLDGKDVIVLAAANWVNSYEDMGWLAEKLEKVNLPVVMVGVGAQSSSDKELPNLRPGTLSLLGLVRDRSKSMAVRGSFSCSVLERYGFSTGVETGCPSLLMAGPAGPNLRHFDSIYYTDCAMHATRHGFQPPDPFQAYLYRQAIKHDLDIVLQSEFSDILLKLRRAENADIRARAIAASGLAYSQDDFGKLESYLEDKGHVFSNIQTWLEFLQTRAFCFGTRIHGVVASILAGTEATLIVHDARTLELAEAMFLPHLLSSSFQTDSDIRIEEIRQPEQTANFRLRYRDYYERFISYFLDNGLEVS